MDSSAIQGDGVRKSGIARKQWRKMKKMKHKLLEAIAQDKWTKKQKEMKAEYDLVENWKRQKAIQDYKERIAVNLSADMGSVEKNMMTAAPILVKK